MRIFIFFALIGCQPEPTHGPSDSNLVYRTVVVMANADHAEKVTTDIIDRQTQVAEIEQRQSGRVPQIAQASCSMGSALWLFDKATIPRSGNEICFYGAGTAQLGNYQDACAGSICWSWSGMVRSFWPGSESGSFLPVPVMDLNGTTGGAFSAHGPYQFANTIVAHATSVQLF